MVRYFLRSFTSGTTHNTVNSHALAKAFSRKDKSWFGKKKVMFNRSAQEFFLELAWAKSLLLVSFAFSIHGSCATRTLHLIDSIIKNRDGSHRKTIWLDNCALQLDVKSSSFARKSWPILTLHAACHVVMSISNACGYFVKSEIRE